MLLGTHGTPSKYSLKNWLYIPLFALRVVSPSRIHKRFPDKALGIVVDALERECGELLQVRDTTSSGICVHACDMLFNLQAIAYFGIVYKISVNG